MNATIKAIRHMLQDLDAWAQIGIPDDAHDHEILGQALRILHRQQHQSPNLGTSVDHLLTRSLHDLALKAGLHTSTPTLQRIREHLEAHDAYSSAELPQHASDSRIIGTAAADLHFTHKHILALHATTDIETIEAALQQLHAYLNQFAASKLRVLPILLGKL